MTLEYAQQAQMINVPIDLQALIHNVYQDAYFDGYMTCGIKGVLLGALITLTIVLLVLAIKSSYDSHKLKATQAKETSSEQH